MGSDQIPADRLVTQVFESVRVGRNHHHPFLINGQPVISGTVLKHEMHFCPMGVNPVIFYQKVGQLVALNVELL